MTKTASQDSRVEIKRSAIEIQIHRRSASVRITITLQWLVSFTLAALQIYCKLKSLPH